MSDVKKVYTPKKLSDLVSLPNLSDETVVLAGNNTQTGKLTLLGLRQYLNVDAIDTDFAGVLASINTLNENVAQNTSDIENLETSTATKLGYEVVSSNTVIESPSGNITFNINEVPALKVTGSGVEYNINGVKDLIGDGNPEGVVEANKGSTYRNYNGSGGQTLWHKVQGTSNTGWVPVSSDTGVNVKDFGAKGDGITDDTLAFEAALAKLNNVNGGKLYIPSGDYVISRTLYLLKPITIEGAGVGGGYKSPWSYVHNTTLRFVGTGERFVQTRALHRSSISDPQDPPISAAINIQFEGCYLRNFTIWCECDYNDYTQNYDRADWDCGILVGARPHTMFEMLHIIGPFQRASIYLDNTSGTNLPEHTVPSLNLTFPRLSNTSTGLDGCSLTQVYTYGARWGLFVQGPEPKTGFSDQSQLYYDQVRGTASSDFRGGIGMSDLDSYSCSYYGGDQHNGYRYSDRTGTDAKADSYPGSGACYLSGMRSSKQNFYTCRFSSSAPFRIFIDFTQLTHFIACHGDFRGYKTQNRDGNIINVKNTSGVDLIDIDPTYVSVSFGALARGVNSQNTKIFGGTFNPEGSDFFNFQTGDVVISQLNGGTFFGDTIRTTNGIISCETGRLDLRSSTDTEVRLRNGSNTALQVTQSGVQFGASGPRDFWGTGTPEGVITAVVGSTFRRTDGGAGSSFYVKESGTGNTGWVAK